jgi:NTE family protein
MDTPKKVGLALSGGGVRAAAFHAGVFKYLAEHDCLERVHHISTVSGGSLFVGLVFSLSGNKWPSSQQYLSAVYPEVRRLLKTKSLQWRSFVCLVFNPLNWSSVLSRADITAKVIETYWSVKGCLGDLPKNPVWSVNATTAENGRRFRFKGIQIGDYETGYAEAKDIKIAAAMAVSAAFPGGIGPLSMWAAGYEWKKRPSWGSAQPPQTATLQFRLLHLYDGGIYDNLGLEPLFDVGTQKIKSNPDVDMVIVVDAGAAFARTDIPSALNPARFLRLANVAFDQTRSLRVRALSNYAKTNPGHAYYLQIGADAVSRIATYANDRPAIIQVAQGMKWLSPSMVHQAACYRTSLRQMSETDFDLIARHGYESACWNDLVFNMTKA